MWNDLSMRDRALLIRLAVSLGITNLDDILQSYDLLATGGPKDNKDIKQWVLDDMARRIEAVENDKSNKEGGWNARKGVWEPHTSVEGGANTIHYGIKLVPANKEIVDLVKKQGYITNDLGWDYLKRTRLSNDYDTARRTFNTYNKDALAWDSLSPKMLSILTDYQFNVGNGGLSVFKNLMNAAYNNDLEGLNREYKRYTGGLELTRNKHIKNELDSILNGFYNIIDEKPIEENNSDVSDVYTDGKLMEYVKAMEESNSKTLPMTTPYNDGNIGEFVKSLPYYKGTPMTTPYNDGWLPGKKADGGKINHLATGGPEKYLIDTFENNANPETDKTGWFNIWYNNRDKQLADAYRNYFFEDNAWKQQMKEPFIPDTRTNEMYAKIMRNVYSPYILNVTENTLPDRKGDLADLTQDQAEWAAKNVMQSFKGYDNIDDAMKDLYLLNYVQAGAKYPNNTILYSPIDTDKNATRIHERTHLISNPFQKGINDNLRLLKNVDFNGYWDSPDEIYSRLNLFRYKNKLNPTHKITNEDLEWLRNNATDYELLDRYDNKFLKYLFNNVAYNSNKENKDTNITAFGGPIIQTANKFSGTEQPTLQMDRGNQPLYDGQIGFGFGYNPETFERYYTGFYNPYNNSYNNATWVDENDEYNIGLPTVTIRPSGESMVNRAQEKAAPVVRDVLLGSAALAGGIPALANAASKVPLSALKPGGAFWTDPLTQQIAAGTLAAEGINAGVKAITPYNSVGEGIGSTVESVTGWNPNNTWLGPIVTEAFNPGWYASPTGMINTVGKIGNIVESKLPAIQKALSRNPLPSYAYEDILKSKFYESLVKEYGEDTATEIAKEISTPEVQRFIIGDNPRTAYKAGKKHAKLMQIIKEVENAGGLLAGSGQLAKHGTVSRNGLLHDLDFNIPGDIITKESPLFDLPGYYSAPRISRRFPFIGKKVMGSNSKGYVNVPHIRLGQYLDMFIKPEMPTEDNIINTILEGKKLFGRPKDVADIATFRPYSVDNPMIDITTGEGQWNPTLFDRGIFTEEGYPFVLTVELYPGSKIKVPAMMNYEGQIKTIGGINNIVTDDYGFNSFVDRLKNSEFPHWSTIRDKDLLNTALNLLIKEYPFVRKIEGNLDDRLKKISIWDLDKLLSNLEHVPTDYERRKLTRFMENFPDEQINEDILKVLQLKYTDDNVNDILNRIANKDFDFRIFDHSIDVPSKYSESVDLQIREALANYEYAPYYNGRYTTPLYIMDDFKDLENLIKAYKNGEKLPYDGMYTLEHSFDYLNPEAPQLLKDIAKKIGLVPNLITKNKVPINLEDGMTIYPGYLLKSLMAGNTLEKLLSKSGNININNIKSLANKASNIEKEIINKVLSSDLFANKTTINYNDFKKAVLDQLIEYDLESSDKWASYGMHSVGLTNPETIILSNRNIPEANASTHFKTNSLGHFRIAKAKDEPNVMYVLENQSDWGLARYYNNEGKAFNKRKYEEKYLKDVDEDTKKRLLAEARDREKQFLTPEQIFLKNEFERKLTLEILLLAALRKMSLVRFPTRDVAAKIEGFNKILEPGVNERIQTAFENGSITFELYELMLNELKTFPQYQEKVLLKYDNFPNLFKKWFKNSDVRSYMDANSNLWYEVDVPQDYLYQEWPYANGGKIHIKPSKRGTFTAAAKKHGKSVQAFASLVLANPSRYSAAMRKKANFARNAAKWHSYGGPIIYKHLGWDKRK